MKKKSITAGLLTFVVFLIITTIIALLYITSAANARRERADFIAKINAMDEELKKMKEKYSSKEKTLENDNNNFSPGKYEDIVDLNKSLFVMNETYVSDIMCLKQENQYLRQKLEEVEERQKEIENRHKAELGKEREERIKSQTRLENDLKNSI